MASRKPKQTRRLSIPKFALKKKFRTIVRGAFLTTGLLALLCGATFLFTDRVVLFPSQKAVTFLSPEFRANNGFVRNFLFRTIKPHAVLALPQWAAMTMLVVGVASTACFAATRRA